jgi:diguanylate cyclase (GGDEF)-like protein
MPPPSGRCGVAVGLAAVAAACLGPLALRIAGIGAADTGGYVADALRSGGAGHTTAEILRGGHLHSALEWTAIGAALCACGLALALHRIAREPALIVASLAFGVQAALGAVHALAATDLLIGATYAAREPMSVHFLAGPLAHACLLAAGIAALCLPSWRQRLIEADTPVLAAGVGVAAALAAGAGALAEQLALDANASHAGPGLDHAWELLPLLPYGVAAALLWWAYLPIAASPFSRALLVSILPAAASQIYMALGSSSLVDHTFFAEHALRIVSTLIAVAGVYFEFSFCYASQGRLIGKLRAANEALTQEAHRAAHEAKHDPVTKLLTRAALYECLDEAIAEARGLDHSIAVLFVDLDRFKHVNDRLGHGRGDDVLAGVARRLDTERRAGDIVARFSGDEFVVALCGATQRSDAHAMAQRIERELARPYDLESASFVVTASIGIACFPEDATDGESLIRQAELAMLAGKPTGGGCINFYAPVMHSETQRALELEHALREAIDAKQFALVYQPQVDFRTLEIVGAEALLRWKHPDQGLISPGEFLPVAERTGLIVPIGSWVIRAACSQRALWNAAGVTAFPISVNVSAEQIAHGGLAEEFLDALQTFGLRAGEICCEVTETCVIRNATDARHELERVRQAGHRVAIDDFGTGYSCFSTLSEFPIDVIKIDRSFVSGIMRDPKKRSIVAAILSLAESLGLDTIAEGIETEEQLDRLRALGCAKAQGYIFARPLDPDALVEWLAARQAGGPRSRA